MYAPACSPSTVTVSLSPLPSARPTWPAAPRTDRTWSLVAGSPTGVQLISKVTRAWAPAGTPAGSTSETAWSSVVPGTTQSLVGLAPGGIVPVQLTLLVVPNVVGAVSVVADGVEADAQGSCAASGRASAAAASAASRTGARRVMPLGSTRCGVLLPVSRRSSRAAAPVRPIPGIPSATPGVVGVRPAAQASPAAVRRWDSTGPPASR